MRKILLALPLLVGSALMAQSTLTNGGLQTGLSFPFGDFASKKDADQYLGANDGFGVHVGGHLDLNFNPHHQLRLQLTANGFAGKKRGWYDGDGYEGTRQNNFGVTQFGGDYVFNATSPSRGGYFLVGLSVNQVKETVKYSSSRYNNQYEITQSARPGFRIGGGYNFNRRFSLEGHVNSVSVDKNGTDGMGINGMGMDSLTWVTGSAVFRFGP